MAAVYAARLTHLREIAEAEGGQDALARRLGVSQPCISQLIGKNPERNISERTARRIERLLQLPVGMLDPVGVLPMGDEHFFHTVDSGMVEVWRPVPEYETAYEVSSFGRVRSIPRLTLCGRRVGGTIMQCQLGNNGYYNVTLKVDNSVKRLGVHQLVARAFIPNPDGLSEVDHIDGQPGNNARANLEWVTHAENMRRAALNGRRPRGEAHGLHRLTIAKVREIRQLAAEGLPSRKIGLQFSVSKSTVLSIAAGRTWGHVV